MKEPSQPAGAYRFRREGDDCVFTWAGDAIEIRVSRIAEARGDTNAEIKITSNIPPNPGCLEWGRINLSAMSTRASLAKNLESRLPFDWQGALLQVAHKAVELRREGEPTVNLGQVEARQTKWLLWPYVEYGGPTVLFADGGAGKSILALMMAYSVASAKPLLGKPQGPPRNVLYLDWETDAQTHAERLRAIHNAYDFAADQPVVYYKRMAGSLADSVEQIRQEVARLQIALVIVDSLSLAVGGGVALEDSATATAFFGAARLLETCLLAISHVSKATVANTTGQKASPFGSAFFRNTARLAWYVESLQEEGASESLIRFEHVKSNNGRYQRQHGYRLRFDNIGEAGDEQLVGIRLSPIDLTDVPEFAKKVTWSQRIAAVLRDGAMTTAEVAEALGEEDSSTVSKRLSDERRANRIIRLPDSKWGLAAR